MNIFTKAKLIKILNDKVQNGEICSFNITETYLRINKSKRTGFTFKFIEYSDVLLINLLKKKTPNPSIENIEKFYKKEIKRLNS
jgi:hypothetical protein